MTDFALCTGTNCPLNDNCKRYVMGRQIKKEEIGAYTWTSAQFSKKFLMCPLFVNTKPYERKR